MPRYLVERTFPDGFRLPTDGKGVQRYLDVVERNADDGVTWLHSYVSDNRTRTFCLYDGPSPEAIRKTAARNRLPIDRITQVRVLDPYFYPDHWRS
jgi:Nickel responsive protein SCO4226-like